MFSQSLSNQHPENKMCWSFESLRGLTKSPKKHEQLDTLTKRKNLGRRHVVPINNDRCRYLVYSPLGSTTQRYIISIHATLIKMNFHLDDFLQNLLTLTTKWSHLGQHKSTQSPPRPQKLRHLHRVECLRFLIIQLLLQPVGISPRQQVPALVADTFFIHNIDRSSESNSYKSPLVVLHCICNKQLDGWAGSVHAYAYVTTWYSGPMRWRLLRVAYSLPLYNLSIFIGLPCIWNTHSPDARPINRN